MTDDLDVLTRDLGEVPRYSGRFVESALKVASMEAKQAWAAHARSFVKRGTLSGYPESIDFDVSGEWPRWESEIGPNHDRRQGVFGMVEDSHGGVKSAPQKARPAILPEVEKDFERGLDKAVDDALRRAGL